MSETKGEIPVGPELDRAVGELMGYEVIRYRGSRTALMFPKGAPEDIDGVELPAYSTSSDWEQVADWLVEQGWYPILQPLGADWLCRVNRAENWSEFEHFSTAPTRAEAVCRAALKTQE